LLNSFQLFIAVIICKEVFKSLITTSIVITIGLIEMDIIFEHLIIQLAVINEIL